MAVVCGMTRAPVRTKAEMYRRLCAGEFGNTIPQWFDVCDWQRHGDSAKYAFWGVRTLTPGGPCRLNCHRDDVPFWALEYERAGHRVNISMMVDRVATVTAWLEAWDGPTGLVVEGIECPDTANGWTWRNSMPDPAKRRAWHGTAARMVLARHLNANSLDDLCVLLGHFPGHVVELSALDRCIGNCPHRNGVVWEVRSY